jgi:protein-S-isoprenylcysteine O-methyltransferase Ste14
MATAVFIIGSIAAVILLFVLLLTMLRRNFSIWPTPGPGTWQSYVFWPLFRGLNVLCFLMAVLDTSGHLGLPTWVRGIALSALVTSCALFIYAFRVLGRESSYGAKDQLVTGGIYRWSRNPQNAMLIAVYGCLAVATDGSRTYLLSAAMMAVYFLMVLCEEPWLEGAYGASYQSYCRRVPRFFNWRRALVLARGSAKR